MSESTQRSCTGAVLAGGASRRMGTPKEGIILPDGRTMIEHVMASLAAICPNVVIVGACRGYEAAPAIRCIPDLHPGAGPLAGLEALLRSGLDTAYLVVPCDQPLLTPALLSRLLDGDPALPHFFRGENGAELDPFPGFFPACLLCEVRNALDRGKLSIRKLIRQIQIQWIDIAPDELSQLRSVNTPEELEELIG